MGKASRFVRFDDIDNYLYVNEGATKSSDIGFYDVKIRVYDNFDEIEEIDKEGDDPDECDDEDDRNCDRDRVAGETWYNITIAVLKEYEDGDLVVDPLV